MALPTLYLDVEYNVTPFQVKKGYINIFVCDDAEIEVPEDIFDGLLTPDLIKYGNYGSVKVKDYNFSYIHVRTPDGNNSISEIVCTRNHYLKSIPRMFQSKLYNRYEEAVMDRVMWSNDLWEIWSQHHEWIKLEHELRRSTIIYMQRLKRINRTALLLDKVFYLRIFRGCPDELIRVILQFLGLPHPKG